MGFYFSFTTCENLKQVRLLIDFMATQDLNYPHYDQWLQKTEAQLETGKKEAILAFSGNKLVGDIVHQQDKTTGLSMLREIKNIRIHPEVKERYFAKFMLRQVYEECKQKYEGLICDTRVNNIPMINFLKNEGFIPLIQIPLYESNTSEIILVKPLKKSLDSIIPPLIRSNS